MQTSPSRPASARRPSAGCSTAPRRVRGDPGGGAHGPRRPRLRTPDPAPRRARAPGRARAPRAAEPDLPGVRRRDRRGPRAVRLHAGAVHAHRGRVSESAYVDLLFDQQVSGVVFAGGLYAQEDAPHGHYARLAERTLPVVFVNAAVDWLDFPRVSCDDAMAFEQALGHLAALGHTRIGLLLGPSDHVPSNRKRGGRSRRRGARGIEIPRTPSWSSDDVLGRGRPGRDRRGCSGTARRRSSAPATRWPWARSARCGAPGLHVPRDVSVVGFDDSAFMKYTDPPLTTVRQPIESMGRAAVDCLVGQLEGAARTARSCSSRPSSSSRLDRRSPRPDRRPVRLRSCKREVAILRNLRHFLQHSFGSAICPRPVDPGSRQRGRARIRVRGGNVEDAGGVGGATPSCTSSTCAALPTATATASATSPACVPASAICATSASTRSGSTRGTPRRSHDGGYDVADYRAIEPSFGTLAEAEALITEALALGIRTIIDVVPNHVSDQHPWFIEAHHGGPGSPMRDRFWFHPGRGPGGERAAEQLAVALRRDGLDPHEEPRRHAGRLVPAPVLPRAARPELGRTPPSGAEHEDILRFWFDRGAAGIRIDSAALATKDPALPDRPTARPRRAPVRRPRRPARHLPAWRTIADEYARAARLVGEVWLDDRERFARYLRPDELHGAFNFDFLACPWDAAATALVHRRHAAEHAPVDAPPSWVLSNHDVTRPVTRYGRADTSFSFAPSGSARRPTSSSGPGGRAPRCCSRGAAGHAVRVPGRGARTPGGRGHPDRAHPGSDVTSSPAASTRVATGAASPCRGTATGRPYGFGRGRRRPTLAPPAGRWSRAHGRGAVRRSRRSMLALYRSVLAPPPSRAVVGRRRLSGSRATDAGAGVRARRASPASSTSARTRSSCPPAPTSSSPATSSKEVRSRRTPRCGSATAVTEPSPGQHGFAPGPERSGAQGKSRR